MFPFFRKSSDLMIILIFVFHQKPNFEMKFGKLFSYFLVKAQVLRLIIEFQFFFKSPESTKYLSFDFLAEAWI